MENDNETVNHAYNKDDVNDSNHLTNVQTNIINDDNHTDEFKNNTIVEKYNSIQISNAEYSEYEKSSDLQSLETYLKAIQIEFKDYLNKYKILFQSVTDNTKEYFSVFDDLIKDYSIEMTQNTALLHDTFSKLNEISDELPQLEDLYQKVREMRMGLEVVYKHVKK